MLVIFGLFLFAVFVIVVGTPVSNVEELYYDAEYEEYEEPGAESEDTADAVPAAPSSSDEPAVKEPDSAELAQAIFDDIHV